MNESDVTAAFGKEIAHETKRLERSQGEHTKSPSDGGKSVVTQLQQRCALVYLRGSTDAFDQLEFLSALELLSLKSMYPRGVNAM